MDKQTGHASVSKFSLSLIIFAYLFPFWVDGALSAQVDSIVPAGGLLITELDYNPPGLDAQREWVEITNFSEHDLVLAGYGLGDEEQRGGHEGMLRFPNDRALPSGESVVVAQTATGFHALFGRYPDYEIANSDPVVPDMLPDHEWADGQFALANDGDDLVLLDDNNQIVDTLNYGDDTHYFTPAIPLATVGRSLARVPAICDTDSAVDWLPSPPSPGLVNADGPCRVVIAAPNEDTPELSIGAIQGPGNISPYLGQIVTFRGIVTGMLQDRNEQGIIYYTLFVQDAPAEEDDDPATSDAIAVFHGRQPPELSAGDVVVVNGRVTEYYGLTEIDDAGLQIRQVTSNQSIPEAVLVELPQAYGDSLAYLEAHEGMLVATVGFLPVVGPTHEGCGFALASVSGAQRPIRQSAADQITPPLLVLNRSDIDCRELPALNTGDLVSGAAGPLTYHFEQYKIVQQEPDTLLVNQAPPVPPGEPLAISPAQFSVVTLNLNNYLQDPEEQAITDLSIKKRKLSRAIAQVLGCPTLMAVQEIGSEELLLELSAATTEFCPFAYEVSHRDSADARGIDVALLSDPRRVRISEVRLDQTCTWLATGISDNLAHCPTGQEPLFSRPPLIVRAEIDGEPLTLIVNHFKSKRGGAQETASRRLLQAQHVHNLVRERLRVNPQSAIIVMGDFNDYVQSPSWTEMMRDGLLVNALQGVPPAQRYTYIFDGQAQLLDGILLSPALAQHLSDVLIQHTNTDYANAMGSNESVPYRFSDHDPILVVLTNLSDAAPEVTATNAPVSLPATDPEVQSSATAAAQAPTPVEDAQSLARPAPKITWILLFSALIFALAILLTRRMGIH